MLSVDGAQEGKTGMGLEMVERRFTVRFLPLEGQEYIQLGKMHTWKNSRCKKDYQDYSRDSNLRLSSIRRSFGASIYNSNARVTLSGMRVNSFFCLPLNFLSFSRKIE